LNEIVSGLLRLALRVVVVAMGLVLFLSLLAAVMVLAVGWSLRAGWARLTGRPVTPWVMRMDPRSGFGAVFRSSERWSASRRGATAAAASTDADAAAPRRGGVLPGAADVSDVEARDVR
jgi:hypothetical protein